MIPTLIGFVQLIIGSYLLIGRRIEAMFSFALLCTLMGGSAAISMPALGGSSIPPSEFALAFLIMRMALPSANQMPLVREGFAKNALLFIFVAWGIATAFTMPHIFQGQINLVPLKPEGLRPGLFATAPLAFSSQNITASINLVGTLMFATAGYVAVLQPRGAVMLVKTSVAICLIHAYLGLSGALLANTPYSAFLRLFRNGSYYQHNQVLAGYIRITGIFPEPSGYTYYGFIWFVFVFECWLRDIMARWTGIAAAALGFVLVISTSSTAYASLGGYGVILLLRLMVTPGGFTVRKGLPLLGGVVAAAILVSGAMLLKPSLAHELLNILADLTLNKEESRSGLQRTFWAKQGIDAFALTHGLGIGAGSFRSSSIVTAILGSTGLIGSAAIIGYLVYMFKPFNMGTFLPLGDKVQQVGAAAGWTALLVFVPASVSAASCDPGGIFGMFAGVALALRRKAPRPGPSLPTFLSRPPPRDDGGTILAGAGR